MGKVMSLATEPGLAPVSRSVSLPPHQGEVQQVLGSGTPPPPPWPLPPSSLCLAACTFWIEQDS